MKIEEIRKRHDEYDAYRSTEFEGQIHKDRGELLKHIEELEAQLMACSDGAAMDSMQKDKRIEGLERNINQFILTRPSADQMLIWQKN